MKKIGWVCLDTKWMELENVEAIACNHLNRGCRGALIGVPSTSSMTLLIVDYDGV